MTHKNSYRLLLLTLIGILMYSCQNDEDLTKENISPSQQEKSKKIIKLGKKLENPFSVVNMQRALDTILKETKLANTQQARAFRQITKTIEIKETDLYVRFLPKDSLELNLIKKDTTLVFYDHPLDYEIEKQGEHYHDPEIPEDQITWQYTVVKPDYEFPKVKYEILSDLFIPENSEGYYEENSIQGLRMYSKTDNLDKLETVALYLTDNLSEQEKALIEEEKQKNIRARRVCAWFICWNVPDRWNPSGTVRIEDTELGWQPVQGVKVRARRWFTTKTGITNSNGYFRTGSFRRPANYSIVWETYQFSIREKWFWFFTKQARMNGPKMKAPWNVNLTKHSKDWFHGTVFQAAYHYYYQNIKGLKRPPTNSFWKPQMKIRAYDQSGRAFHNKNRRVFGVFSWIHLYRYENNSFVDSEQIYNTAIHELAHASHWELRKGKWNSGTNSKVKESWALGVAWFITKMKYPNHNDFANTSFNWMKTTGEGVYTPYFIDLFDNNNQGKSNNLLPFDNVSGYSFPKMERALKNSKSLYNVSNNLDNGNVPLGKLTSQYINLSR